MSCFDVVYHQSTHHPGYLAYQRSSLPSSPLKKRCRLDPDLHQGSTSYPADGGLSYDRGLPFPGIAATATADALKPDPMNPSVSTSTLSGQTTSRSSASSSFSSALTSPSMSSKSSSSSSTSPSTSSVTSSSRAAAALSATSSSTSSVVVALKCELMTSSSNDEDDDAAQRPVMTQSIGGNGVLLTYFSEDIDTNIDNHFHRALQLAQQHGARRSVNRFGSAASASSVIAEGKTQASSCCREESSSLSPQRSFPPSFWNTVSCSSSHSSSSSACPFSTASSCPSSSSSYHPSNGSWSSLMVSPSKADPLAAAFTVSPSPSSSDPYHHLSAHFASAASPPGALGPLHQDPWNPYSFCPPPPPPPSQSSYRRYRHSIHEFSFSDSPCSLSATGGGGGSHLGSGGMRYKSLLNGRDDPKSHAAAAHDVWRSRCYGCADVTTSHIAAGFTLTGDIEVTQTTLPEASVKDVYWF